MNAHEQIEILLVEDSAQDAEMLMRALKKSNFVNTVRWVRDGAAAMDFLNLAGEYVGRDPGGPPGLILLDLKMPKVSGFDVLRAITADERLRTIPVMMVTSSNLDRDVVECYQLGAKGFIVKPVEFSVLSEAVAKIGMRWVLIGNDVPA